MSYMTQNGNQPNVAVSVISDAGNTVRSASGAMYGIMPWIVPPIVIPLALVVALTVQILMNAGTF